jgi:heme oxygenase
MLSEELKESTKKNHQLLEKALVSKIKAIRSEKEYAELLTLFYSYFGGLESCINEVIDGNLLPDNEQRRKTQALANDLEHLGFKSPERATGDDLPQLNTHLQALGALYVIEGSTLGGKIISKMMQQQLGLDAQSLSFFTGYGDKTEHMWDAFKMALNKDNLQPGQQAEVIAAANETFLKFGQWFEKVKS